MPQIATAAQMKDACCSSCPLVNGYLAKVIPGEAGPVLGDSQPSDRAALHRWAREQLREVRRAVRRRWRMERHYRRSVLKARGPQQEEHVRQRLDATQVDQIARGLHVNTAALRRAGVLTAADARQRTVGDLENIRGIGLTSARRLKDLVDEIARVRAEDIRPPGNPDTWRAEDFALVRALVMLTTVLTLGPHAAVLQQVLAGIRWLARATNWLAWLFSTPQRKDRVWSEAPGVRGQWFSS